MPRTGRIHRRPHNFSSTPGRQHSKSKVPSNKTSHRFERIYRKFRITSGVPSKTQPQVEVTPVVTSQTAKPADRNHKVDFEKNGHLDGEVTAIPNPIPETGFRPTLAHVSSTGPTSLPSPTVYSVPLNKTGLPAPSFSTLPSLLSFDLNSIPSSSTTESSTSLYAGPEPSIASAAEAHQTTQSRKLSIPVIVLLAVGSGLVLIGIFTLIKYYSRPTRRPRPKPSLPILDDPFADDNRFPSDESPIFGGKETMSPRPGTNGAMWSWSQYPRPGAVLSKPEPTAKLENTSGGISYGYGAVARSPRPQAKVSCTGRNGSAQHYLSGHSHSQSVPIATSGNSPYQASLHQVQGALSRAASRISAASMSLYPASPQTSIGGVGLAIGGASPMTAFTADGSSVLKRTEPKAALARSRSNSIASAARVPASKTNSFSEESTDEGSDLGSPSFLPYTAPRATPLATHGGRTRIKSSYYTPGYPRASNAATRSEDLDQPSIYRSESRRDRDTQALTYALGLSSPATHYAPPSPQPTLYPDDSLSVVDAKRPRKPSHRKKGSEKDGRPTLPVIATAMDGSAALGSLMLMDFSGQATRVDEAPSTKRMSRTGMGGSRSAEAGAGGSSTLLSARAAGPPLKRKMSRSDDKPPSIPLPAPLPSLTQMGLEHANPQAYADYRSPTYSIYGLYGNDRKSAAGC